MKERRKTYLRPKQRDWRRLGPFHSLPPTRNLLVLGTFLPFVASLYQVLETTCLVPLSSSLSSGSKVVVVVVGHVVDVSVYLHEIHST
jgi:hypothetical protein